MTSPAATSHKRRFKVHGGHLGPFLCWAVVFADIGTSIYYVPGILYGPPLDYKGRAAIFVVMTLFAFVLLCIKYAEVAWRYPGGGGVVTVASQAIHPFLGLFGGLLIMTSYYLTAALSALSGVYYLGVLITPLTENSVAVIATVTALVGLAMLNVVGIRESARAAAVAASLAAGAQVIVVVLTAIYLGPAGIVESFQAVRNGPPLTAPYLIVGFGAAFLAFSGLESIAQVSPAMREPRKKVAGRTMTLVVVTMAVTSPLLTLWSTVLLSSNANPNQFISLLGAHVAGVVIGDFVAVTASVLLIFASNTAIIGGYHVLLALARMGFLPRAIESLNSIRRTPHNAILGATVIPIGVVILSGANVNLLGDLYSFGLVGSFVVTCACLDVVRWRARYDGTYPGHMMFGLGLVTTAMVVLAWSVNMFEKPLASEFGGGLTAFGLVIAAVTYRANVARRPATFPVPYQPRAAAAAISRAFGRDRAEVLVILPHEPDIAQAVLHDAAGVGTRSAVFMYRSDTPARSRPELMEVTDPYLRDYQAQDAFARAEMATRKQIPNRRYVYLPGSLPRDLVEHVWTEVHPKQTIVRQGDQHLIPSLAIDRVRHRVVDGVPILHLVSSSVRAAAS